MKNIIVLCAVSLFLLAFPLQYTLQQQNHKNITEFQKYVNAAKEQAKQKGYFTNEIIEELKSNIVGNFKNIDENEIYINVTTSPKYRVNYFDERELINYEIGVPIKKILASNLFWGIPDTDNQYMYYIKGSTSSELVMP